jgi:hypothetical protein
VNAQESKKRNLLQQQNDQYNEQLAIHEYQQQQMRRGVSLDEVVPPQIVTEGDLRNLVIQQNRQILSVKASQVQILNHHLFRFEYPGFQNNNQTDPSLVPSEE